MAAVEAPPAVPAMVTDPLVALVGNVMTPLDLPWPIVITLESITFVPLPRTMVLPVFALLLPLAPQIRSATVMLLLEFVPALASVNNPLMLMPFPTASVPVALFIV